MKNLLDIPRTAMEVFEMLPEGTACEVIDNTLYMSPSPTTTHQKLLLKLAIKLQALIESSGLGDIFISPCDVYLNNGENVVQPDILFVSKTKQALIAEKGIMGAPDMVIEILSTNKEHDLQRKFQLYQQNAIAEYIIIDPETKQVWQYLLRENLYQENQETQNGKLSVKSLPLEIEF
ncbi:Uma2 family endonuclease [Mucilaginibacter sp. RS28]|uniref:Uma2 family endonuclease n=1 Tax=Mucilaginibacter straminoryzae TaxID=2932774 RepID=A0A9X1X109_9SPHI|nr:Uma2 family endonuclease [Mucilaginibacter straminoryzae]MCJ8208796.1 Uma2 family endonuclease [Mucilaginibacter straminoryzae]